MSDPLGFISANELKSRNSPDHAAERSAGAVTAVGSGADATGGSGADNRVQVRPFTGFVRERAAYERLKPELLTRAEGKFVVLVGEEVEGPFDSFGDALRAGYRRFGHGPLYIKQLLTVEPVVEVSHDLAPCRS